MNNLIHLISSPLTLSLIGSYGYFLMFILMIIEGPLITYISGFAASMGIFNVYYVFILSLLGNLISDLLWFSFGKFGNKTFLNKYTSNPKYDCILKLKNNLENNTGRCIAIIKCIMPLAGPGLVMAGMSKISFKKFTLWALILGIPFAAIFTIAGYSSGITFSVFSKYLKIGSIAIVIAVIVFILLWLLFRKLSNKLENKIKKSK